MEPSDKPPGVTPQRYHPGSVALRRQQQAINVHFHVDGQEVAQQVTQIQMAEAEFPTRAPYNDGNADYSPPDINLAWGEALKGLCNLSARRLSFGSNLGAGRVQTPLRPCQGRA